jgi:uncharacterized protein
VTDRLPQPPIRIQTLDVLRGFAVLGILAVNIAAFGLPLSAELVPAQVPFASAPGAALAQWFTDVFFTQKFVALFSMLFGISIFLVGGEKNDPVRSPQLKRRLLWLALFGLLHGAVFWYGDILLLYALTGLVMALMRSMPAKRLIWIGGGFTLLMGLGQALTAVISPGSAGELSEIFGSDTLASSIAAYRSGWPAGLIENLKAWGIALGSSLAMYSIPSLCLMMLGLGLFKAGFFHGRLPRHYYLALMAAGALVLALLGLAQGIERAAGPADGDAKGWDMAALSFPVIITLGYASALILATARLGWLRKLLAPVGQMAFTNYLTQTLMLTALFSMPFGPRLMGQLDYVQMWGLVVGVWVIQIIWSPLWLKHFRMGPFEWVWRCLTHKQRLPLRRV